MLTKTRICLFHPRFRYDEKLTLVDRKLLNKDETIFGFNGAAILEKYKKRFMKKIEYHSIKEHFIPKLTNKRLNESRYKTVYETFVEGQKALHLMGHIKLIVLKKRYCIEKKV